MDIVRENTRQSGLSRNQWLMVAGGVLIVLVIIIAGRSFGNASYIADRDQLLIGTVQQGDFAVQVRGPGVLVPKNLYWLTAEAEGRVEQIFTKAGSLVEAGDPIVKLSNPETIKEVDANRWDLEALIAENHAAVVSMESELLAMEEELLNTRLSYDSKKLTLDAQDRLFELGNNTVSAIDYETTKLSVAQYSQRIAIQEEKLAKMRDNLVALQAAHEARVNKMRNTLRKAEAQVDALLVRATINGVLQEMPLELGQSVQIGANVAKLAQHDQLLAQLDIQEVQVREVALGQPVTIDTRNSEISGVVSRIDPVVNNGVVTVDVELNGELPAEARPDLSVNGVIEVAQMNNVLYAQRPVFAQSFSNGFIYRLTEDGSYADRVAVQLGQGSTSYIEVINGLSSGDRIIISDPSAWESHQRIQLN